MAGAGIHPYHQQWPPAAAAPPPAAAAATAPPPAHPSSILVDNTDEVQFVCLCLCYMENRSKDLFPLFLWCCGIIGPYDFHNGASRGRERERATESA